MSKNVFYEKKGLDKFRKNMKNVLYDILFLYIKNVGYKGQLYVLRIGVPENYKPSLSKRAFHETNNFCKKEINIFHRNVTAY